MLFQCKRHRTPVGTAAARDFRGATAGRGGKRLLITIGSFTAGARAEAVRNGAPPIDLIGGERLCGLLREHRIGVEVLERIVQVVVADAEFFAQL